MAEYLTEALLELARRHEPTGVSMGVLVDSMTGEGFDVESVESEVWRLLAQRRLTPNGFVCRRIRRRDETGETVQQRTYEFLLVTWSRDLDNQLELGLDAAGRTDGAP
jgi:hypothetical protein